MNNDENNSSDQTLPSGTAAPYLAAGNNELGDDDWLGCESLHPLTWLPSPAAKAGVVLPS
jgi:hypothetical protein